MQYRCISITDAMKWVSNKKPGFMQFVCVKTQVLHMRVQNE